MSGLQLSFRSREPSSAPPDLRAFAGSGRAVVADEQVLTELTAPVLPPSDHQGPVAWLDCAPIPGAISQNTPVVDGPSWSLTPTPSRSRLTATLLAAAMAMAPAAALADESAPPPPPPPADPPPAQVDTPPAPPQEDAAPLLYGEELWEVLVGRTVRVQLRDDRVVTGELLMVTGRQIVMAGQRTGQVFQVDGADVAQLRVVPVGAAAEGGSAPEWASTQGPSLDERIHKARGIEVGGVIMSITGMTLLVPTIAGAAYYGYPSIYAGTPPLIMGVSVLLGIGIPMWVDGSTTRRRLEAERDQHISLNSVGFGPTRDGGWMGQVSLTLP